MISKLRHGSVIAMVASLLAAGSGYGQVISFSTVALTGDPAPGTDPNVVYSGFNLPVLNGAGQTAFSGNVTGAGVDGTNDEGIWSEGGGSLGLVARTGDAAPGTGAGVVYGGLGGPLLDGAGQTAFGALLTGPGVVFANEFGFWSEGSGSLSLLARKGDAAPGTGPGVVFDTVERLAFNASGQAAFWGILTGPGVGPGNRTGMWSEGGGSLGLLAREGDAAPGTAGVFGEFSTSSSTAISINGAGQTAFRGVIDSDFPGFAIWTERGGSLGLVVRRGDPAPGTGPGVVFQSLLSPVAFNTAGQTAFAGNLDGPGVDGTNQRGYWSEGSGSLSLLARTGDPAPGTGPGVVYDLFSGSSLMLNGAGQTAFRSLLTGTGVDDTNDSGIWSEGGGSLALVARSGDAAPGTEPGVVYDVFGRNSLNGAGQTAFRADLTGTGVDSTNDRGIWVTDLDGVLTLIAREGDLFDVDDDPQVDDLRTISGLDINFGGSGGEDGRPTGFNDLGQLAFQLDFTDGSAGVFIVDTVFAGDFNGDGIVDGLDFLKWQRGESPNPLSQSDLADWEANYGTSNSQLAGDFDLNGEVNGFDFLLWQRDPSVGSLADWEANYGMVATLSAASAAVPEPTTCALALAAVVCVAAGRRRS